MPSVRLSQPANVDKAFKAINSTAKQDPVPFKRVNTIPKQTEQKRMSMAAATWKDELRSSQDTFNSIIDPQRQYYKGGTASSKLKTKTFLGSGSQSNLPKNSMGKPPRSDLSPKMTSEEKKKPKYNHMFI